MQRPLAQAALFALRSPQPWVQAHSHTKQGPDVTKACACSGLPAAGWQVLQVDETIVQ